MFPENITIIKKNTYLGDRVNYNLHWVNLPMEEILLSFGWYNGNGMGLLSEFLLARCLYVRTFQVITVNYYSFLECF